MPDENGQSRRDRYALIDDAPVEVPPLIIPEDGQHIWDWYFVDGLKSCIRRIHDGVCEPIPPSEYIAWAAMRRLIVRTAEYDILSVMDAVFCEEVNKELAANRAKRDEDHKAELEKARRGGARGARRR